MPKIKNATLDRKKLRFGPKNVKKRVFMGFFVETPGKRLAILLQVSDDAQTYRIADHLVEKGVPIIRKATLVRAKLRFGPKHVEKKGFLGFSDETPEKHFGIML